jgi:hypothetical protein
MVGPLPSMFTTTKSSCVRWVEFRDTVAKVILGLATITREPKEHLVLLIISFDQHVSYRMINNRDCHFKCIPSQRENEHTQSLIVLFQRMRRQNKNKKKTLPSWWTLRIGFVLSVSKSKIVLDHSKIFVFQIKI